jgi:hypothetical protein
MKQILPALQNEIDCINKAYGWHGFVDAFCYIQDNEKEYFGTQCYREYLSFVKEMKKQLAVA